MKKLTAFLFIALVACAFVRVENTATAQTTEGYKLIVNVVNTSKSLQRQFVADAFLKRATKWPNGRTINPVDMPTKAKPRYFFSSNVIKRSPAQVRNYWTQQIFSGRNIPPPELTDEEKIVEYVKKRPGAIGYVSIYADTPGVKVVEID